MRGETAESFVWIGRRSRPAHRRDDSAPSQVSMGLGPVRARMATWVLVVAMALGCFFLWTVIPLAWLWLAASVSDVHTTVYLVALVGCPVTMVLWGWVLYRVNDVYLRRRGEEPVARTPAWLASSREARGSRPAMLLDRLLVVSALLAPIAVLVWMVVSPSSDPPWPGSGFG